MGRLDGKVAVVTGASKGIGAAIAKDLANAGASVVVNYATSEDGANKVVEEIRSRGGKAVAVKGDVSQGDEAASIIQGAIENFGKLDILVNNSGVFEFGSIDEVTGEHFHKMFNVNVLGLLYTTQAAAKVMTSGASIINIGSAVTSVTPPNSAVYSGTKGAVDTITGVLAKELAPRNIRVNSINPGMVETEGVHSAGLIGSDMQEWAIATTPLGRIGQVDDIAPIAVFLASDESKWLTGERISASGGAR